MIDDPKKPAFDTESLRAKYAQERVKRLQAGSARQYAPASDDLESFSLDPRAEQKDPRPPINTAAEVAIVGGGFGGLVTAARLKQAGITDILMIERGGDFGGTWYWNRYPGAACDVESYIYLPMLEEVGSMPSHKFAKAPEILAHARRIAEQFELYDNVLFHTRVNEFKWDAEHNSWQLQTDSADRIDARFIVLANGPLDQPKLPGISGIQSFRGHTFHTSRWDYEYTGGSQEGNLTGLADKTVGIIGTGATAVQCVPALGRHAKHLFVFQRTPSAVDARNDPATDPSWFNSLDAGWQRRRMANFTAITSGLPADEDLVDDEWTRPIRKIQEQVAATDSTSFSPEEIAQLLDYEKMEKMRQRISDIVDDPDTAEALKPWYNRFCKRPCFDNDYLPTFNRPNVSLIDTNGLGVESIDEAGVWANGQYYPLDCLIFATGFEVGSNLHNRAGYELVGRNGLTLSEKWKDGMVTLHGMQVGGFPNCFIVGGNAQAALAINFSHMIEEHAEHVAYVLSAARDLNCDTIEVTAQAEQAWTRKIIDAAGKRQKFQEDCTPGFYNNEGMPHLLTRQNSAYGAGPIPYIELLHEWRDAGTMPGLRLSNSGRSLALAVEQSGLVS